MDKAHFNQLLELDWDANPPGSIVGGDRFIIPSEDKAGYSTQLLLVLC